jgi:pimeloyl-ACP methyl ester carboxylesterase
VDLLRTGARLNRSVKDPRYPPKSGRRAHAPLGLPLLHEDEDFMDQPLRDAPRPSRRTAPVLLGAAALLGATALLVRARARKAERRHPPVGRFVSVDGVRLHYVERGQGSTIVLLHGNGAMIEELVTSGLVEALALHHRVIVFDRPGFGHSERPRSRLWTPAAQARLIREALAQLGVRETLVYGHSLGAQIAVSLALLAPDLVRGLVLAAGYYYPTARADVPFAAAPAIPVLGHVLRYTVSPTIARLALPRIYSHLFGPAPVPERFQREFPHDLVVRPWQLRAAAADSAFLIPTAAALQERYSSLGMPLTIIAGESDRVVEPARHACRLHAAIPGSRLLVIPGAGHMVHHAAPEAVVNEIESLAAKVSATGRSGARVRRPYDRNLATGVSTSARPRAVADVAGL